jgi:hypothetical protein
MFDEQGDHGRLPALAALLGAVDRTPYSSHFAGVRHAKPSKRFDEPLSVPLKDEILPFPYDDGTHSICHAIGYSHFEQRGRWIASRMGYPTGCRRDRDGLRDFPDRSFDVFASRTNESK